MERQDGPYPWAGRLRPPCETAFELGEEAVDRIGQGGAGHRLDRLDGQARRREQALQPPSAW